MDPKSLPFDQEKLQGISAKTLAIHHDKLYVGYVTKANEIRAALKELGQAIVAGTAQGGNQTYSLLRGLKEGETFATNGVYLHEWYFEVLGGDGASEKAPELTAAIAAKWGSLEGFITYFSECGMAARGWAVLAWDTKVGRLKQYNCDSHNQGGVWGAIPIIVLDVYEHAYFLDYGSDRKSYITDFWRNFNWARAEELYLKVRDVSV